MRPELGKNFAVALAVCIFLASCTSVIPILPTLTPAYTPLPSGISLSQVTPTATMVMPTSTSEPSLIPIIFPTSTPTAQISDLQVITGGEIIPHCGRWSPTKNEVFYYRRNSSEEGTGKSLVKMTAPDFTQQEVGPAAGSLCDTGDAPMAWSKNGQIIYYSGPNVDEAKKISQTHLTLAAFGMQIRMERFHR